MSFVRKQILKFFVSFITLVICTSTLFANEWMQVCNKRFGTCAEIPSSMKKLPPSANGDGEIFTLPNRFKVSIYGAYNIDNLLTREYFEQYRNKSGTITYSVLKNDWFVESGFIGDWIFYHKVFVSKEKISGVYIEYPKAFKRDFDAIVTHISRSLTYNLEEKENDFDNAAPRIEPTPERYTDALPPNGLKLSATGSAFRIENGSFITNQHVISGCRAISVNGNFQSGIKTFDKDADLAVVSVIGDIGSAVSIRKTNPQLNEQISVAGYPLQGLFSGLSITNGNISRLSGIGGDTSVVQISAPVQPGNSGGPVIDDRGQIVGVVVSKLDAGKLASVTGDISQNVNFAIKNNALMKFLDSENIRYTASDYSSLKSSADIAKSALNFTVLVECYK
jgi:Trypsin-like peptidase domain